MKVKNLFGAIITLSVFISLSFSVNQNKTVFVDSEFKATLNDSTQLSWTNHYYSTIEGENGVNIFALTGNNVVLKIHLNSSQPGTYLINGRNISVKYYLSPEETRNAIQGLVTITANENNALSGTFTFTDGLMENGINITNGVFTNIILQ